MLWQSWKDSHLRISGSKPLALLLGYSPVKTKKGSNPVLLTRNYCLRSCLDIRRKGLG